MPNSIIQVGDDGAPLSVVAILVEIKSKIDALTVAFNAHTHQYNGAAAGNATSSVPDRTAGGQAPLVPLVVDALDLQYP